MIATAPIQKEEKHPFIQKLHLFTIGYFILLAVLAFLIYQASPSPVTEEIRGLSIGKWQEEPGRAYLSGRRLECVPTSDNPPYETRCEVEIAGKMLTVDAYRNDPESNLIFDGGCEAFYDGESWPCKIGSRHTHVHWFAFVDASMGLNDAQMDDLRRTYFFENLSETPFISGILITAIVTTILILVNFLVWVEPKVKIKWFLVFWGLVVSVITFYSTVMVAIVVTNGFWD